MVYLVKLAQSGNSAYLNLPKPVRRALRLHRGDTVAMVVDSDRLVVTKLDDRKAADVVAELWRDRAPTGELEE